jgi:hypothetical protein
MSTKYLDYIIYLTDAKLVQANQHTSGQLHMPRNDSASDTWTQPLNRLPPAAIGAPANAARKWGAPVITTKDVFTAPCISDSKIVSLTQTTYPIDQDEFERGPGGFFGWILGLFGAGKDKYIWRGTWQLATPAVPTDNSGTPIPTPEKISQRRWIDGFEFPDLGEGGSVSALSVNRASSRHVDGYGFNIRGNQTLKKHNCNEYGAAAATSSWERLYIRIVKTPTARTGFWRCHNSVSDAAGVQLAINPSGTITILDTNNSNAVQVIASTVPLVAGRWYRLDLLFKYSATVPDFKLYINGALAINAGGFDSGFAGLCRTGNHISSDVGWTAGADGDPAVSLLGLDIDDWMNAVRPAAQTGLDWLAGSRMVPVLPKNTTAANAWTGEWRSQLLHPAKNTGPWMESSTSGERLALDMNADIAVDKIPHGGAVAAVFGIYNSRAGTADGELGYSIAGATPVMAAIVQSTTVKWNTVMYRPSGLSSPQPITPLELHHTKAASTDKGKSFLACAVVECIGVFGGEDVLVLSDGTVPDAPAIGTGLHNAPYPRTSWAQANGSPPEAPVVIVGGSYSGNDTSQDLIFRVPVCFLYIRRVDATNNSGTTWWSSMMAAHRHFQDGHRPEGMVQALIDPDFIAVEGDEQGQQQRTLIRITGNADEVNKSGETYVYMAFCDPGMRFALNFALSYHKGTLDRTTRLVNAAYTPIGMFLHREVLGSGTTTEQWYKGPGHTGSHASKLSAAETDLVATFAAGQIVSKSGIHVATSGAQEIAAAAFRLDDGSADPGIPNVVWIGTYTGDGTGNRTITCRSTSTKYPLWALVVPHNAASVFRDHEHTTTTSTTVPAVANSSNGIRGGDIGKILVGSDLNANGIVYDFFVVPGGTSACNNGFSCPGEFVPVVPIPPPQPGPWPAPVPAPIPPPPGPGPSPTPIPVPVPWVGACKPKSTNLFNIALARVGITKPIGDVETERSPEVNLALLVFTECVEKVLRDFPWPWATSYRALQLLAGDGTTPATQDWLYTYQEPSDCVFARRLVKDRTGAVDATPPPFELSSDADNPGLIYTNEAGAVLEYTSSPGCAARCQDPLFREALICQLVIAIAPALSRITTARDDAEKAYAKALAEAALVVRPGIPGLPPTLGTDGDALCVTENLAVVNLALLQIGAQTLVSLRNDQTREALAVRSVFEHNLLATLRDFPWPFATKYATLAKVGGTATVPVNDDWQYSYRVPSDCVFVRRVVNPDGRRRTFDPNPPKFRLAQDDTGELIFVNDFDPANSINPTIEYTQRTGCTVKKSDPLFREAFAWRLSAVLAPSLSAADPQKPEQLGRGPAIAPESAPKERQPLRQQLAARTAEAAWAKYHDALMKAQTAAANEQQPELEQGDADWIRDRQ